VTLILKDGKLVFIFLLLYLLARSEKNKKIGSSNSLSRRLDQYFTFKHINQDNSGQLLPLIKIEGFDNFSLEIFIMPTEFSFHVPLFP
jgi:hypothetical protein